MASRHGARRRSHKRTRDSVPLDEGHIKYTRYTAVWKVNGTGIGVVWWIERFSGERFSAPS